MKISGIDSTEILLDTSLVQYVLKLKVFFIVLLFSIGFTNLNASHISGGSIKYKSLGGTSYYIEAAVFRDCSGIQITNTTARITAQCMPSGTPSYYNLPL